MVISYPELAVTILTVVLQNIKICLTLPQASRVESEQVLQRRLEEVSEELRSSQSTLEKAQQDATSVAGKTFTFRPCLFEFQWTNRVWSENAQLKSMSNFPQIRPLNWTVRLNKPTKRRNRNSYSHIIWLPTLTNCILFFKIAVNKIYWLNSINQIWFVTCAKYNLTVKCLLTSP